MDCTFILERGAYFVQIFHCIGESRILTNFTGSFSDVITIAHEHWRWLSWRNVKP